MITLRKISGMLQDSENVDDFLFLNSCRQLEMDKREFRRVISAGAAGGCGPLGAVEVLAGEHAAKL